VDSLKKIIAVVMLTLFCSALAMAADDLITLPAKNASVTFNHKKHQDILKDCKVCHEKGPGKIEGLGKDWAHKTCTGCHVERNAGPTKCRDCHRVAG